MNLREEINNILAAEVSSDFIPEILTDRIIKLIEKRIDEIMKKNKQFKTHSNPSFIDGIYTALVWVKEMLK